MADLKISELSALAGGDLVAADELAIVDDSASETKKITVSNLIANGVTLISDDAIPGAKILFAAGDIATAALADAAVTTAKIADDGITAAKIADNVIVDLVSTLPASGDYTGQLALDTDDNSLYVWSGSAWLNTKAPASVNAFTDTSAGIVNITTTISSGTATVTASIDDTTAAAQFLAGPVGSSGAVGYRAIDGGDLPAATTTAKGGVIVNGNGLVMDGSTIEIDNSVTASSVNHLVTYDANGLITGGRVIASSDLPVATTSARGAVIASSGLAVDASGNLSIDNTVTSGTYTKVTVTAQGVVSAGTTLTADDIPDHSAAKLTSGTIGTSLIANDAVTAAKMADQSTVKFGGALGSDNVTIFPAGDFKGQLFWDETSEDLYIYSGSAFVPITVISGNLVNAGAYNANTNTMSSVTTAGSSAGFSAGAALPAPAAGNLNHYVVVDTSGTGTGAAPAVALAPPDMLLSQGVGTEFALIDVSNAIAGQTASNISFIATGTIAATDVQAALQEVDGEKVAKAGDTMTGDLNLGDGVVIVFEGSTANDYETTLTVTDPTADRTITLPNVTGTVVTTGDTGSVTSTMITDGTIVNADINASAEIAVSKLANGTARQLLQTAANGSDVEFTSNVDVPGTLDVTGAATLDSTLTVTGLISADGKVSFPAGTAAAPSLYSGSDTNTGIYSPGSDQLAISTNGTAAVTVDSSQRVGIGTTSPGSYEAGKNNFVIANTGGNAGLTIASVSSGFGEIAFADGTAGSEKYRGQISYDHTNDALKLFTAASEALRIDSSGRLGLGTSSPVVKLDVNGGINLASGYDLTWGGAYAAGIPTIIGSLGGGSPYIAFRPDGSTSEAVRILDSGRVGIGTTSPISILHTSVNTPDAVGLYMENRADAGTADKIGLAFTLRRSGGYAFNQTRIRAVKENAWTGTATTINSALTFSTYKSESASERMRIDSSGQLLIGETSAGGTCKIGMSYGSTTAGNYLEIGGTNRNGNGTNKVFVFRHGYWGGSQEVASIGVRTTSSTAGSGHGFGNIVFHTGESGNGDSGSTSTERMRINSGGTLTAFAGTIHQFKTARTSGSDEFMRFMNGATTMDNGTTRCRIRADGDLENTNNSYTGISDQKLKENIVEANSQWSDIKALQVRNYNFKQETNYGTHRQIGLIAQEVEIVSPGLVKERNDVDAEGNDLGTTTKSVNYSVLYMKAVKALQEAMDRIETLEAKVAALEAA